MPAVGFRNHDVYYGYNCVNVISKMTIENLKLVMQDYELLKKHFIQSFSDKKSVYETNCKISARTMVPEND